MYGGRRPGRVSADTVPLPTTRDRPDYDAGMRLVTSKLFPGTIDAYLRWFNTGLGPLRSLLEQAPVRRRCIFVIDDDSAIRAVLRDRLTSLGFSVLDADDGTAALARMSGQNGRHLVHGVLLDLHLPAVDGLTILESLREEYPQIPVIVMADLDDIPAVRKAMSLGAHEYLLKPFEPTLLERKCLRVFSA